MDDKVKNCILDFISNIKMPEYEEIFSTDIVMWAVKSAYRYLYEMFVYCKKLETGDF